MKPIYNDLGILNEREVSKFKLSLVSSKFGEQQNKILQWLGLKSYHKIDSEAITLPDSKIAGLAIEEANDVYPPSLLKHCYRTYFFSAGLAFSQKLKIDKEVLFTTSILHDIGLTGKHNAVCSKKCFAVYGGNFIKDFAIKNGMDEFRAAYMEKAIAMHLNPYVDRKKFGNEAYFLSKGAAMDVIGAHSFQLSKNFIDEIHKKFPRTDFREAILHTMTSLNHQKNTRAAILFKMGFQQLASKNTLDSL